MLGKTLIVKALEHRRWATARIFESAAKLSAEQYFGETGYGHGSLHSMLFHVLRVDNVWRNVVAAPGQPLTPFEPADYPDLATIRAAWQREDEALTAFVTGLSEEELGAPIQIRDWRGNLNATVRAYPLVQVLMHELQHNTEAAFILSGHGQSPGNLDFVFAPGVLEPTEG